VQGTTSNSAFATGVYGLSSGFNGIGVIGECNSGSLAFGVYGTSSTGYGGVFNGENAAVSASSGPGTGVRGSSNSGLGVAGSSNTGTGVQGTTYGATGVSGFSNGLGGNGVVGTCNNGGNAYGVWGTSTTGWGVFCSGKFGATGTKSALIARPDGAFDSVYCVESPECWLEDFGRVTWSTARRLSRSSLDLPASY
jgi:hypothetical protein